MVWALASDEEAQAIRSLATDSDRSAAIVAASLVEISLQEALLDSFRNRDEDVIAKMFHSSAPLGSFSAKIRLAYLMGVVSEDFHSDLDTMKEIRNRFAHHLSAASFKEQSIRDRTKNFKIVEHVATDPKDMGSDDYGKYNTRLAVPDCENALQDPRQRYLISAQIFTMALRPIGRNRDGTPVRPHL